VWDHPSGDFVQKSGIPFFIPFGILCQIRDSACFKRRLIA
jgi:hypothetical protein